jgi:Uma2 family endonuclease
MVQAIAKPLTFDDFLEWYPEDGKRYELISGQVVEMRPIGDHEEISGLLTRKIDREIETLNLPYFIPKTCCVKPSGNEDGYIPDVIVLDRPQLQNEPLWKKASTIIYGNSVPLVIEVVSTNWQDDYAKKLEDYEEMGIAEYWIADYRALGGKRHIGSPKQPTFSVYAMRNGLYQLQQFRGSDRIISPLFSTLNMTASEILNLPN